MAGKEEGMITFDEHGARFDGEGTLILKTDHLAEIAKKDEEIRLLRDVAHDHHVDYLTECRALHKEIARLKEQLNGADECIKALETGSFCTECGNKKIWCDSCDYPRLVETMNPCGHTGFESVSCQICGYPDPRKLITKKDEEIAALQARIKELEADLSTNATMLARQSDLARDAERVALAAERKILYLQAKVTYLQNDNTDRYTRIKQLTGVYDELIMEVGKKYEDETRHQTALRYIRQVASGGAAKQALGAKP